MSTILGLVGETNINRPNPETALAKVQSLFDKADALIGHMETTVSEVTSPNEPNESIRDDLPYKKGWKHSKPETLNVWKLAGFDAVGCASNCSGSETAVQCEIKTLNSLGIAHAGVGLSFEDAHKPAIFEKNGEKFGLLSYTSVFYPQFVPALPYKAGAATVKALMSIVPSPRSVEMPGAMPTVETRLDEVEKARMLEDIANLRPRVDHLILSCHWGCSSSPVIQDYQKEFAHAAIDAGTDAIMGHHPHLPQGIEIYKGKPVFYSMGNFAFDWWFCLNRLLDGIMAYVTFEGKDISKISFAPARRDTATNDICALSADSRAFHEIVENIQDLSKIFNTKFEIAGNEVVLSV